MRYKEYNVNSVLEKCIQLFWKTGFRACSINDIVETTGVNRFSLYEEFNNKEGILLAALQLYKERYSSEKFKLLENYGMLEKVLYDFYVSFFESLEQQDGCFVIHIGTELADNDIQIKIFVENYIKDIEELFIQLLNKHLKTKSNS